MQAMQAIRLKVPFATLDYVVVNLVALTQLQHPSERQIVCFCLCFSHYKRVEGRARPLRPPGHSPVETEINEMCQFNFDYVESEHNKIMELKA